MVRALIIKQMTVSFGSVPPLAAHFFISLSSPSSTRDRLRLSHSFRRTTFTPIVDSARPPEGSTL